jgi:hypothetical protein
LVIPRGLSYVDDFLYKKQGKSGVDYLRVSAVEGFGFGRAIMSLPIMRTLFGEPNEDDPEGGAGYLTSDRVIFCSQ